MLWADTLVELWSPEAREEDEEEKSSQKRVTPRVSCNQVSAVFFSQVPKDLLRT